MNRPHNPMRKAIKILLIGLPPAILLTFFPSSSVYRFFINSTGNSTLASIAEKVAVEITNKTVALLLVAVAFIFIRDFLNWNQKQLTDSLQPAKTTDGSRELL